MSFASSPSRLALIPLSLLLAYGSKVHAQQEPVESDKPKQKQIAPVKPAASGAVQKVEVSGAKGYDERRQDTASKIVVTQEEIERYGDTNIGDVLKRLPGVTMGGVQGRGGAIRMRGLGAGYTQIMLNGEPSPPGFSLDSISPDNIERIEVIRSATAELSTQSIAGAINIVLKKAIVTAQRELKAGLNEESGKVGVNASLQFSDKLGKMSYSVSANLHHGEFERPDASQENMIDKTGRVLSSLDSTTHSKGTFSSFGLSPRINWMLGNGDIVTSQSFVNVNRFTNHNIKSTDASVGTAPIYSKEISDNKSDSSSLRSNLTYVHKLADSAKLDARFGFSFNQREGENITDARGETKTLHRIYLTDSKDSGLTYGGKYTAPFVEDHALATGWDGSFSKRREHSNRSDTRTGSDSDSPVDPIGDFDAKVTRLALFVQDEWNYSKALSIYAGVRWEGIDTTSKGNNYAEIDNRSSVLSPIFQTLYKIPGSKNDQLRFALARTYKAPDTGRLVPRRSYSTNAVKSTDGKCPDTNLKTSPDSMGNPKLKPELAWGLDAGIEHYLSEGGVLSVNFYLRRIEDFTRVDVVNDGSCGAPEQKLGRWVAMPINDGLAITRGVEFDAKFPLRALMEDAPAIDFRANLAFNASTVKSVPGPNNRLDSQTPVSANFGLDYKLNDLPLTLGGNVSFQSAGTVRVSTEQSTYGIPKRVVDLYALWKFDNKTNMRIAVGNALHQDHFSSSTFTGDITTTVRTNTSKSNLSLRANFEMKF